MLMERMYYMFIFFRKKIDLDGSSVHLSETIQMKATEQYFHAVLFFMLYKISNCDNTYKGYLVFFFPLLYEMFGLLRRNSKVWPLK